MPQKLNKAGKMQDYIPKGNGDASGEYGTSNGTNKNFTTSDKKKTEANVITENKSVVVGSKDEEYNGHTISENTKLGKYIVSRKDSDRKEIFNTKEDAKKWIDNKPRWNYKGEQEYNGYTIERNGTFADGDYKFSVFAEGDENLFKTEKEAKDYIDSLVKNNKANVIDNDLTGKKSGYDDSDIRNMKESDFPNGAKKEWWESTTKKYEDSKPLLDKMGVKIEDINVKESKNGGIEDNTRELADKLVFKPFQEKYPYGNNKAWKEEGWEDKFKAIENLEMKIYTDWWIRNENKKKK